MANAILYFRTVATLVTPIASLPSAQRLEFTPPDDLASGIDEEHENNIVRKIPPKPSGRRIIQTDEGFKGWILTLSGNYIIDSNVESATKLFDFINIVQAIAELPFGVFGIFYPNGPSYLNIDPNSTKGLMIMRRRGKHIGLTKEIFDFSATVSYGGDI